MLQVPARMLGLKAEIAGRDALPALLSAWEDLCRRSVEDNVYYSPRYARALLESVDKTRTVNFAVVWQGSRLVALLPFTTAKFAPSMLRPAGQAWRSKYIFSCMPLLDKERQTEAAGALLDLLASIRRREWMIATVNTQGEACRAMIAAIERRGSPWALANPFQRAAMAAGASFDDHMRRQVSSKRRKDLSRNRRRLEALGKVEHHTHCFGEGLDRAVSAFLAIEAGGWKGRRGTALACHETTRQFAIEAFTGEQASSICRADVLTLDGAPIAVSLITLSGRTGFTVKGCYDEAYRSCSAGLLLEVEVIRSFLSENWASRLDSATAGAHVIDSLWPERIEVADLIFSLSTRQPALRLSALRLSDQVKRTIKAGIKRKLAWLRRS